MATQWPTHVAIIPDGNGRWATQRGMPRAKGHQQGSERLKALVKHVLTLPAIKALTVFGFSTENNKRPLSETRLIMSLIRSELKEMRHDLLANNIRFRCIGDRTQYPSSLLKDIVATEDETAHHTGLTLTIALHYSGRWDITQAVQLLLSQAPETITDSAIQQQLQTHELPDPDLLIRTSGEQRISNFLLWPLAYTELYMTPCLWPDFDSKHFDEAITWFQSRERRFGDIQPTEETT